MSQSKSWVCKSFPLLLLYTKTWDLCGTTTVQKYFFYSSPFLYPSLEPSFSDHTHTQIDSTSYPSRLTDPQTFHSLLHLSLIQIHTNKTHTHTQWFHLYLLFWLNLIKNGTQIWNQKNEDQEEVIKRFVFSWLKVTF